MSKEEMIDRIYEIVQEADAETVEQFYWFLMTEFDK